MRDDVWRNHHRQMAAMYRRSAQRWQALAGEADREAIRYEALAGDAPTPAPRTMRLNPNDRHRLDDLIMTVLRDHGPATSRTVALLLTGAKPERAHNSLAAYGQGDGMLMDVRRRVGALERRGAVVRAGRHERDSRQVLYAPASVVLIGDLPPLVTTGGRHDA